jgi:hypothetical protein
MVLLACAVACGSSGGGASSPGAAGEGASGGGAGATGGAGTELCPDGTAPTGTEPTQCPELMPTGGTCCSEPGMACFYPGDDDSYRKLGLCFDDPQHPPYWQETLVLDRMLCQEASDAIEIGSDALACSERETVPCDPQGIVTPQELLDGQFDDLVVQCGGLPNESSLEVEFTDGCATGLVASISGPVDDSAPLRSCIEQALDKVHFACADGLDCAGTGRSTLK